MTEKEPSCILRSAVDEKRSFVCVPEGHDFVYKSNCGQSLCVLNMYDVFVVCAIHSIRVFQ